MDAIHLCQYDESRLTLLIAVTGPDNVVINTSAEALSGLYPSGITILPGGTYNLTWVLHGEIVWYDWYANCTFSTINTWEWFSTPQLGDPCLTPAKPACEYPRKKVFWPDRPTKIHRPRLHSTVCAELRRTIDRLRNQ